MYSKCLKPPFRLLIYRERAPFHLHDQVTAFIFNSCFFEIFNVSEFEVNIWFTITKFFRVVLDVLGGHIHLQTTCMVH